jgi:GTP pyrophosphokinase
VHRQFEAEPFRFKDYIAEPKANGYRSLHTTLRDDQGRLFEVQIRSRAMHLEAEDGTAAHWRYRAARWTSFAARRRHARWRRLVRRLLGR